jgi:hypothetical protein
MTRVKTEPLWTARGRRGLSSAFRSQTLYQWRYRRTGPRACRVGRYLRYSARPTYWLGWNSR